MEMVLIEKKQNETFWNEVMFYVTALNGFMIYKNDFSKTKTA